MGARACKPCKSVTIDTDLSKQSRQRLTLTSANQKTIAKPTAQISDNARPDVPTSNWPWDCPLITSVSNVDKELIFDQTMENNGEHDQPSTLKMENKPNLFRPGTITSWDMSDIEDLEDDMQQQLKAMVSENTQSQDPLTPDEDSSSNLIRTFSHDWDTDEMEIIETQMRESLKFLQGQYED